MIVSVTHYLADEHAAPCGAIPGITEDGFTEDWSDVTCTACTTATSPQSAGQERATAGVR